jgi:hypothetical protein
MVQNNHVIISHECTNGYEIGAKLSVHLLAIIPKTAVERAATNARMFAAKLSLPLQAAT